MTSCASGRSRPVGDLGQAKYPWCPDDWSTVASLAAPDRPLDVLELSVNYRTPAEIMDIASRVLALAHSAARSPVSVRRSGEEPVVVAVASDEDLSSAIGTWSRDEAARVAPGKVAVIRSGDAPSPLDPAALDQDVVELNVDQAKGLEFDSVVLVQPTQILVVVRATFN